MSNRLRGFVIAAALSVVTTMPGLAQNPDADPSRSGSRSLRAPHLGGSRNVTVVAHVPLGGWSQVMDIEMEQELSRPYVYVARADFLPLMNQQTPDGRMSKGVDIISIKDPAHARRIYSWRVENQELHTGLGGMDNKYFKLKGRYYDVQSLQFFQGGPDTDVGATVLDVTNLPDTAGVKEVGRLHAFGLTTGFHNIFAYRHSNGQTLLIATTSASSANVYDMEKFLARGPQDGMVAKVPNPDSVSMGMKGYHDLYVGYDPTNHRDVFYGAGLNGYYVYDISNLADPKLLTSITGGSGIFIAHTITPDPTGRYAVAEVEYQYSPLRIYDLKPGLDGTVKTVSRPIGAWANSWDGNAHNHEVRWPYVFVAGYMDGLQVFNMMDPTNPYTVGGYYTCDCVLGVGKEGAGQVGGMDGAFGVDVRNADGLIVVSDRRSGFWAFKMDGFDGWNGHQWGLPNASSVQDWDNGPEGAPKQVS
ncbi:MAG: hypothetical protein HY700_12295 [Gemmatimonadetes bacterium]|nr:hypothetical protein [Gemmatimonadota bacterium]